ncbi:Uncharacterised protein [Aeromonas encheleia]|uniref:hypothetical protein n=1 Tax=Aeromonas encheleia TaxID=73010 RepID=UPI000A030756|nr:hypothetical protein [Aeromonas encheleia]VEG96180.1 Uncharacterised protein [Aeromonas encheleia]
MDDKLIKRYLKYANSEEALAVLFVKKHLIKAKGYWIDIDNCRRYEMSMDKMHFRFVTGGLYIREIKPKYPPKSEYTVNGKFDEDRYYLTVRAITWETAHRDIEQQKAKKISVPNFRITGVSYEINRDSSDFFVENAPPEIKALAKNLSDRTNYLWDIALKYVNKQNFVYKIKTITIS